MNQSYNDITDRIQEEPKWWDECGVPRYCDFEPRMVNNIYADQAVLLEVACSDCGMHYDVAMSARLYLEPDYDLINAIRNNSLFYGDPPNYGHAEDCAGATMSSNTVCILEVWQRPDLDWERLMGLEGLVGV